MEEDYIQQVCADIIVVKPDLVITEKGVSDLAQHFLVKAGISVIRRVRKTDNNRIARWVWREGLVKRLVGDVIRDQITRV